MGKCAICNEKGHNQRNCPRYYCSDCSKYVTHPRNQCPNDHTQYCNKCGWGDHASLGCNKSGEKHDHWLSNK